MYMKHLMKQITAAVIICIVICSVLALPVQAGTKNTYWMSGVSRAAEGSTELKLKNKNTIIFSGNIRKYSGRNAADDAEEIEGSYSLKVAGRCKVVLVEADNNQTWSYSKWLREFGYKKGDEISYISTEIKVKNNKIIRIYFSA